MNYVINHHPRSVTSILVIYHHFQSVHIISQTFRSVRIISSAHRSFHILSPAFRFVHVLSPAFRSMQILLSQHSVCAHHFPKHSGLIPELFIRFQRLDAEYMHKYQPVTRCCKGPYCVRTQCEKWHHLSSRVERCHRAHQWMCHSAKKLVLHDIFGDFYKMASC